MPRKRLNPSSSVRVVPCEHAGDQVIDRSVLSHEQHLILLAEPKDRPKAEGKKRCKCGEDESRKALNIKTSCSRRLVKNDKNYIGNFLSEIWQCLTPDMTDRLKGMLMLEFGMNPEEAEKFLNDQRKKHDKKGNGIKPPKAGDKGGYSCDKNVGIRNMWRKQFSKVLSAKLTDFMAGAWCERRSKEQFILGKTVFEIMNDVLMENVSYTNPKTVTHRLLVLAVDRLTRFLIAMVREADRQKSQKKKEKENKEDSKKSNLKEESQVSAKSQGVSELVKTEGESGSRPASAGSRPEDTSEQTPDNAQDSTKTN